VHGDATTRASPGRLREGEDAAVPGTALGGGQPPEGVEELRVVLRVRRVLAGEPTGSHAGAATERVDLDARVVGERGEPREAGVERA
jgi:hypothetical protein